jgi:hypothetical protein
MKASLPFKYIIAEKKGKNYVSLISRTIVASVRENGLQPICLLTVLIKH